MKKVLDFFEKNFWICVWIEDGWNVCKVKLMNNKVLFVVFWIKYGIIIKVVYILWNYDKNFLSIFFI